MQEEMIRVDFDPDFDMPAVTTMSSMNVFEALGGKWSFWSGFGFSLLLMMSIGFLILLKLLLAGNSISLGL